MEPASQDHVSHVIQLLKDGYIENYIRVSQIRGTILGVPIIRIIVFWGLYWGPPILGSSM